MIAHILPSALSGCVRAPASKSAAHRALICAALSEGETEILCPGSNADIEATLRCLTGISASCERTESGFVIRGGKAAGEAAVDCGESGSTRRFLIPVAAALGTQCDFYCAGRLPQRPLDGLRETLAANGVSLSAPGENPVRVRGGFGGSRFTLPGNISSQFVSGLLFALPLLPNGGEIRIEGPLSSANYVEMTLQALKQFGISVTRTPEGFSLPGGCRYKTPGRLSIEGDWSGAAFWLCAGQAVSGLSAHSAQGDRAILDVLARMGAEIDRTEDTVSARGALCGTVVDADPIPDLVPPIAAAAVHAAGETRIVNAARLRDKESDRLRTTAAALNALGARVEELPDGLIISGGKPLTGGTCDSCGDHRIAMAAAVGALRADGESHILGAECVAKSYPGFWRDLARLGGRVTLEEGA